MVQQAKKDRAGQIGARLSLGMAASPRKGSPRKKLHWQRKHDEFAVVNYLDKANKYHLDRGKLDERAIQQERQRRRIENARAKREQQEYTTAAERYQSANRKVRRIRDLSSIKESQKKERRDNAIAHQEKLRNFLKMEQEARRDERPIQYAFDGDTSAFGQGYSSILETTSKRKNSQSASRSPMRSSALLNSAQTQKTYSTVKGVGASGQQQYMTASRARNAAILAQQQQQERGLAHQFIPVRNLDFY